MAWKKKRKRKKQLCLSLSSSSSSFSSSSSQQNQQLPLKLFADQKRELFDWKKNRNITSSVIHVFGNEQKRDFFLTPVDTGLFHHQLHPSAFGGEEEKQPTAATSIQWTVSIENIKTADDVATSTTPSYYHQKQQKYGRCQKLSKKLQKSSNFLSILFEKFLFQKSLNFPILIGSKYGKVIYFSRERT